ncbi:MAG TPA: SDR family oxidoreductase [Burkholderiales bacterium]
MRVLILGGDGMLGHRLLRQLRVRHEVKVTLHQELPAYARFELFTAANVFAGVDVRDSDQLAQVLAAFPPHAIVNCVGIVKQRAEAGEAIPSLQINSLLPHRLAQLARVVGARLVHLSTDCVFAGTRGDYREDDPADPQDLYGRSKLLGEVSEPPCLTLRTSMIGPELIRKRGLLEWFLAQRGGAVKGFTRAIFSGFTTAELSRVIERLLTDHPAASGLYHVSSEPISKHDLLRRIDAALGLQVRIAPDDGFHCDRSLNSERFRAAFGYSPPSWDQMVAELAREIT